MRRIVITILLIFVFCCNAFADTNISFVYINGSNNNDKKMTQWYMNGVKKLHPVLRKKFIKNSTLRKYYKNEKKLNIKEEPAIFFWGDKSRADLEYVKEQLDISGISSSVGAFMIRKTATEYLHDAIWVQKPHNMLLVLNDLNDFVKNEVKNGYDVVLYGYSAGSFVTYEYLLTRIRYINLLNLFKTLKMDDDFIEFVKANPRKNTCVSAIQREGNGLGTFSVNGHLLINDNVDVLKKNYLNIDEQTDKVCAPENSVKGIINFASPLPLFYSEVGDIDYEVSYYSRLLFEHVYEKGLFWLTINYREDPMGYPFYKNLTASEMEDLFDIEIDNPSGVIYDNSSVWSRRPCFLAHTSYWSARSIFSKAVVKTFIDAYRFQYDEAYQKKALKRRNKQMHVEK